MLQATQKHLNDLKEAGFDISALESQIQNPILEKQADRLMGGGILRQQEFSQYMTKTTEEKKILEAQVKQLAALHDSADSLVGNDAVYREALELIAKQEAALITAGYDEEEVKALSLSSTTKLTEKLKPENKPVISNKETEDDMGKVDLSDYIDNKTFQAAAANQIYGSVALNSKVQAAMLKAQRLGIELTDENVGSIAENLRKTIEAGGTIDDAIDKNFGISAREQVVAEENQKKAVDAARAEGLAEGLKQGGVPRRSVSTEGHPLSKISHVKAVETEKVTFDNVPENKFGDKEIYKTRGNANSRIANAQNFHEKVLARESNLSAE